MENDNKQQKNVDTKKGIKVSTIDVHLFDLGLQELINKFMGSGFVRGMGTLVALGLALVFGIMFLMAGVNLVKGKGGSNVTTETEAVSAIDEESETTSESGKTSDEEVEEASEEEESE